MLLALPIIASGIVVVLAQSELSADSGSPRTTGSLVSNRGALPFQVESTKQSGRQTVPTPDRESPTAELVPPQELPPENTGPVAVAEVPQVPDFPDVPLAADDRRVGAVQALLAGRPLAPLAAYLVAVSDSYGIDWRLLPVISILESSGGSAACGGNAWGYAACRVRFGSFEEGGNVVARTLASPTYAPHDIATKLCIWVSGHGCTDAWSIGYAQRAAGLFERLGGYISVPAMPSVSEIPPYEGDDNVAAEQPPPETATPLPTLTPVTPTAEPSAEPSPTATETVPATPTQSTATPTEPSATATPAATATPEE